MVKAYVNIFMHFGNRIVYYRMDEHTHCEPLGPHHDLRSINL